ncbi:MAG: hypothetical protein ACFFD4_08980 [Candidatus Odinarchaeota archaeon]
MDVYRPENKYFLSDLTRGYIFPYYKKITEMILVLPPPFNGESANSESLAVPVLHQKDDSEGKIEIKFYGQDSVSETALNSAKNWALFVTGLNDDYDEFFSTITDQVTIRAIETVGKYYRLTAAPPYQMLLNVVISQNTTAEQYRKMLEKFAEKYGVPFILEGITGKTLHAYPALSSEIDAEGLREIGFGYRDKYIINTLEFIKKGNLDRIVAETPKEAVKKLVVLNGVGQYSARCFAIYGMKHYSSVFIDSYVKSLVNYFYKNEINTEKLTLKEFDAFAERKWGRFAAIALEYLFIYYQPYFVKARRVRRSKRGRKKKGD